MAYFPRCTPSEAGVDPKAVLQLYRDLEKSGNVSSCMVLRHGKVISEGWWKPFAPEKKHMLFSMSKSFTSIASAFAACEGKLDRDKPILDYFPEYRERIPDIDGNIAAVTTRHLLSMTTGHEPNADYIFSYDDCVGAFFSSRSHHSRGVGFLYNTGATYMVSAVVRRVTGEDVADYLRPRLFEPLGITDYTWEKSADGTSLGGYGLSVLLEDLAKFGQFLLNRGAWEGKQLLPAEYIDEATAKHINNWPGSRYPKLDEFAPEEEPEDVKASDWQRGYGQQFWRCVPEGVYRGDGAYGQICVVMPKYDMVVVSNAGDTDAQKQLNAIWDNITDETVHYTPDAGTGAAEEELKNLLSTLIRPALPGKVSPKDLYPWHGKKFELPVNPYGIRAFRLYFSEKGTGIRVLMKGYDRWDELFAPCGEWREGQLQFIVQPSDGNMGEALSAVTGTALYDEKRSHLALCSGVGEDGILRITVLPDRTPFRINFALQFNGGRAEIRTDGVGAPECSLTAFCC